MAKLKESTVEVKGKKKKAIDVGSGTKLTCAYDVDLVEMLAKARYEKLVYGKTDHNDNFLASWVDQEFDNLKKGLKDPDIAIRSQKQFAEIIRETQGFFDSKKALDSDFIEYQIHKQLFDWQKKAFSDPSRHKVFFTSRRAGKSILCANLLVAHCLKGTDDIQVGDRVVKKPRCASYIGLTIQKAVSNVWIPITNLVKACRIPTIKIDNSNYRIDFSNGAYIQLLGNNSKAEREKIRGADWSMSIIDESQSMTGLPYLLDDILSPIIEARHGTLILAGTGPLQRGYWSDAIEDQTGYWKQFHATIYDNPTIENPDEILEQELRKLGGNPNNSTYKREWLGEIAWSEDLLIYPKLSYYEGLPKDFKPVYAYIGCDFGFADYSAIPVILIDEIGQAFVVSEWKKNKVSVSDIYNQLKVVVEEAQRVYHIQPDNIHIVTDTNEQMVDQELYNRGLINIELAIKHDKKYHIALLNEAFASGMLKVKKDGFIADEASRDSYKFDNDMKKIIYEEDDKVFHADILDACLYAWTNYQSAMNLL